MFLSFIMHENNNWKKIVHQSYQSIKAKYIQIQIEMKLAKNLKKFEKLKNCFFFHMKLLCSLNIFLTLSLVILN
jgi:hypothetical protein